MSVTEFALFPLRLRVSCQIIPEHRPKVKHEVIWERKQNFLIDRLGVNSEDHVSGSTE